MTDTLHIVRGAAETSLASRNRSRLGLLPHSEAFDRFIEDQNKHATDINRRMIGVAVSRYRLWPELED